MDDDKSTNGQISSETGHPGAEPKKCVEYCDQPANAGEMQVNRGDRGRFSPGQSGNPLGKRRGTKHFKTIFLETLSNQAKTTQGREIPYDQAIVERLIKMAVEGNIKAIEMIMDRVDGKPKQAVEFDDNGPRTPYVVNDEDRKRVLELFDIRKQKINK